MTTWVLTREVDDTRIEREVLNSLGVAAVNVPCIETVWNDEPWHAPNDVTLFTSKRTVEAWVRAGRPALNDVVALAPTTATACRDVGLVPSLDAEGGVVMLAERLVTRWRARGAKPTSFSYPTSHTGFDAEEQLRALELLAPLGPIDRFAVYDVAPPADLRSRLAAATVGTWAVIFSSPSAVRHFVAALGDADPPKHVLCVGLSTARAWNKNRQPLWPPAHETADVRTTLLEVNS